jgi:hypothetical protein
MNMEIRTEAAQFLFWEYICFKFLALVFCNVPVNRSSGYCACLKAPPSFNCFLGFLATCVSYKFEFSYKLKVLISRTLLSPSTWIFLYLLFFEQSFTQYNNTFIHSSPISKAFFLYPHRFFAQQEKNLNGVSNRESNSGLP